MTRGSQITIAVLGGAFAFLLSYIPIASRLRGSRGWRCAEVDIRWVPLPCDVARGHWTMQPIDFCAKWIRGEPDRLAPPSLPATPPAGFDYDFASECPDR